MLDWNAMSALELEPRRYVALSEAEAAELGTGTLNEWRLASRNGVHVDAEDFIEVMADGAKWRGLVHALVTGGMVAGTIVSILIVMWVTALVVGALS